MITVHLNGGLGNQLFQLAFLDYMSKKTGKQSYIGCLESPRTYHSKEQYFECIFQEWKKMYKDLSSSDVYEKLDACIEDWGYQTGNIRYLGHFQRYEYIEPIKDSFISKLSFNSNILEKYPYIHKRVFLHIRGGDYLSTPSHNVLTKKYYDDAIQQFEDGTEFVIFTNDVGYSQNMFSHIPIITESELDTLFLMSKCSGCICANSSFSWWGAFLDSKRKICIPSKWVNYEYHHESYRVPGWTVI